MSNKEKKLYFECNSGISGDMVVGALLDLGADEEVLNKALKSLDVSGFETKISRVNSHGLDACDFEVILDKKHENHDHDMNFLHGEKNEKHDMHSNEEHHHEHRGIKEIFEIINNGEMTNNAKRIAIEIFDIIAGAESKAHGVSKDDVHFHEVGAVDSIVDIVAVAVCFDNLGVEEVIVPGISEGHGSVRCQHGVLPVPVPAVLNIVSAYNLPLNIINLEGEFVTPTGAAIVADLCTSNKLPEKFIIKKVGMGAGKRKYERPSVLRVMLIEDRMEEDNGCIYKLETNIDDCTGESLGYVMKLLLEAGARDVNYMPVYMKKNRPAYQLNVICDEDSIKRLEDIIFIETTTIGIRKVKMERTILKRELKKVNTPYGEAIIKVCELPSGKRIYPEYESLVLLCRDANISYGEMYKLVVNECLKKGID